MAKEIKIVKRDFYILNILFLLEVRQNGLLYSEIQDILRLNDGKIEHALRLLCKDFMIIPRTIPTKKGKILVKYELTKRGKNLLKAFHAVMKKYSVKTRPLKTG